MLFEDRVVFLLGSNLGDRIANLRIAKELLGEKGELIDESSIYESDSWGYESGNKFLNQALVYEMYSNPTKLLEFVNNIEKRMGRKLNSIKNSYSDRIIDIDIQFYGSKVISLDNLKIPHPSIQIRKFALLPLNELISDFIHPVLKRSITRLLIDCPDQSNVYVYEP